MKTMQFAFRAIAVASLAAGTAAAAADRPVTEPGFVRKALEETARCLLDDRPGMVRTFLQTPADGKDAARLAAVFNRSGCNQSASGAMDLAFSPALLRGAFYKQLYVRDFATKPATPAAAAVDFRAQVDRAAPDAMIMRQYAACVVQRDAATARKMVLADSESASEAEAFNALQPAAGLCTISGSAANVSKALLTGLIAEALYVASAGGTGEGPHA